MSETMKRYFKIGDNLMKIRKERKLNQTEFAALIGVTRSTYSNYENNNRIPDEKTLNLISEVLKIPIPEILGFLPTTVSINNENNEITQALTQNISEINESIALQSIFNYINFFANQEHYVLGSGKEYNEIIDLIEEIVRGKILLFKQNQSNKIAELNRKKSEKTTEKFLEGFINSIMDEISDGKEIEPAVLELLKKNYEYLPDVVQSKINKYLQK